MALFSGLRTLGGLTKQPSAAALSPLLNAFASGFATDASTLSKKDLVALLDQRDDPEADTVVRAYLRTAYQGGKAAEASAKPSEELELVAKVERKYLAAQIVEYGIQNVAVPLAWDKDSSDASLRRYVAQITALGEKAGFESPAKEIAKRLGEASATAETVRELLARAVPYTSPEFHAALVEALTAAEAETNSTVTLDGGSPGFAKFADKVKALAKSNGIPFQALIDAQKPNLSEDAAGKAKKDAALWAQSAAIADISAELAVLKAEAAARLDKHLSKTSEQVRAEQAAAVANVQRKIDQAKGAKWAVQFQKDLQYVKWFDEAVAADPKSGPRAAV